MLNIKDEISHFLSWKSDWANAKEIIGYIVDRFDVLINDVEVRNYIHDLRLSGKLIIAGQKGYLMTKDLKLIGKYVKSRWGELTREMKVLKAMDKACNGVNQWTIEDYNDIPLEEISQDDWCNYLTEMRVDPDDWCDYMPEDYGFKVVE